MSFERLQDRLTALQETNSQLRDLIDRLATKRQPDLSTEDGDDDLPNVEELRVEIGQFIREQEDDVELLQEELEDIQTGRQGSQAEARKLQLKDGAARLGQELQSHRVSFRRAQMAARKNIADGQRAQRRLGLESLARGRTAPASAGESSADKSDRDDSQKRPGHGQGNNNSTNNSDSNSNKAHILRGASSLDLSEQDQRTVAASHNVTDALRGMHEIMVAELSKSDFAHQTLEESTAAMKQLGESYGLLGSMVTSSMNLIGSLVRSQKSDTWYLQTAFYMLLATLSWLVFRRFLYGPLWWLVWLPVRILVGGAWRFGTAVSSAGGPSRSAEGVSWSTSSSGGMSGGGQVGGLPGDAAVAAVGDAGRGGGGSSGGGGGMVREVGDMIDGIVDHGRVGDEAGEGG